jgi:zeaxanthin epoxidase
MPGILEYVGGGFNRFGLPAWLGGASHGGDLHVVNQVDP